MSRGKGARRRTHGSGGHSAPRAAEPTRSGDGQVTAFSFGDPEPVLNRRELLEHIESWWNGRWFEPPVSLAGLSRAFHASPHHESAMRVKINMLAKHFIPSPALDRTTFEAISLDLVALGNCYLEERRNRLGGRLKLERSLAKYTRRGREPGQYFYVNGGFAAGAVREHEFPIGSVCHVMVPDLNQELYGLPEYLGALQSAFLNENATLFRRRYYLNGSHAGFIMYLRDANMPEADVEAVRTALKASKGPGNFRNLFLHAPGGEKDGVQLIPVSEVAAKDEFLGIKNTTRDDVLAAHRVPPQLLGVVPANAGGFGDVGKAAVVFFDNEIEPLQRRMLAINDWCGEEVVQFETRPEAPADDNAGGVGQARAG